LRNGWEVIRQSSSHNRSRFWYGRAASIIFAQEGAKVVAVDYVGETAEETVRMVKEKDGEAIAVKADVSHWDDVNKAVEAAVEHYGKLDIMVNTQVYSTASSPAWRQMKRCGSASSTSTLKVCSTGASALSSSSFLKAMVGLL